MGYDHRTVGFEEFDLFLSRKPETVFRMKEFGDFIVTDYAAHNSNCGYIPDDKECPHKRRLRLAVFNDPGKETTVVEEYVRVVDRDCDGTDVVSVVVYPLGKRPDLKPVVMEP
jgi:hypothetical protein